MWFSVGLLALLAGVTLNLAVAWYQGQALSRGRSDLRPLRPETFPSARPQSGTAPVLGVPEPAPSLPPPTASPRRALTNRPFAAPGTTPRTRITERPVGAARTAARPVPFPRGTAPRPSRPAPQGVPAPPAAVPLPPAPPLPGDARLTLRNDTGSALDFEIGADELSGTVAPNSQIAVPLTTGDYDIKLRTAPRSDNLFQFRVERGGSYTVAFGSRDTRVIRQ